MRKEKLCIDEQIEHMKSCGIKFNITTEEEAKKFLVNSSYFFKVKAFCKNFSKVATGPDQGKYLDLEFAYLIELSTLDMHFRRFILGITLDVEHYLKVKLLNDFITEHPKEECDGYSIVEEFFSLNPEVKANILKKKTTSYCCDLINKYSDSFAIWNVIEVLSFGEFINFYTLYYKNYSSKSKDSFIHYLGSVRYMRNAAAHNNCMLNTLSKPYTITIVPSGAIQRFIKSIPEMPKKTAEKKIRNPIIHDFVVLLYVFYNIVSSENVRKHTFLTLNELFNVRMMRHNEYFKNNDNISSTYEFVKKCVDFFAKSSI